MDFKLRELVNLQAGIIVICSIFFKIIKFISKLIEIN
jgi:hypothetical protein